MNSQKQGFAPILILLVVVAIIGVLFLVGKGKLNSIIKLGTPAPQATSDPTANWKVYFDAKSNFSLKYPSDWKLVTNSNSERAYINSPDFVLTNITPSVSAAAKGAQFFINPEGPGFMVDVKEGSVFSTGPSQSREFTNEPSVQEKYTNIETLTVDGQKGIKSDFQGVNNPELMGADIQIEKDGNIYALSMVYSSKDYQKIFNQILSTFKFTK